MKRLILIIVLLLIPITAFATGENLYPTEDEENGKWGYVDDSDHWIIPASFDWAEAFRGDYATVTVYLDGMDPAEHGKIYPCQGIINRQGEFVLPPEYYVDSSWGEEGWGVFGTWEEGYYVVGCGKGPVGFFDVRSGFFSGLKYSDLWSGRGNGDLIPVLDLREGIYYLGYAERTSGKIVIPCEYYLDFDATVTTFQEDMGVLARVAGIDEEEDETIPAEYRLMTRYGEIIPLPEGIIPYPWADMSEGLIAVEDQDTGLLGYADSKGHIVIEPQYEVAREFEQGKARVMCSEDEWALIDTKGNILLREEDEKFTIQLSETEAGKPCYAVCNEQGLYGYIDTQGRLALPYQFSYAEDFYGDYARVEVAPTVSEYAAWDGLIDCSGKWVFQPAKNLRIDSPKLKSWQHGSPRGNQDGIYTVSRDLGECGYLDVRTDFFSGFIYEDVIMQSSAYQSMDLSELIPVVMDRHLGYVCRDTGEIVIPCKYDLRRTEGFRDGYAIVAYEDGDDLLIDHSGREIYPPKDAILEDSWVENGLYPVRSRRHGLYGYMNMNGEWALLPVYEYASGFVNGYAHVIIPEPNGWRRVEIDTQGMVQDAEYQFVSDDIYYTESQDSLMFFREDHTPLFSVSWPGICNCLSFNEHGVTWYEIREPGQKLSYRAGLMNDQGRILTEPVFRLIPDTVHSFTEGLSPVEDAESGLVGYVDETGNWVIQPMFDSDRAGSFYEGSAWVKREGQRVLIDRSGSILYAEPNRRW